MGAARADASTPTTAIVCGGHVTPAVAPGASPAPAEPHGRQVDRPGVVRAFPGAPGAAAPPRYPPITVRGPGGWI